MIGRFALCCFLVKAKGRSIGRKGQGPPLTFLTFLTLARDSGLELGEGEGQSFASVQSLRALFRAHLGRTTKLEPERARAQARFAGIDNMRPRHLQRSWSAFLPPGCVEALVRLPWGSIPMGASPCSRPCLTGRTGRDADRFDIRNSRDTRNINLRNCGMPKRPVLRDRPAACPTVLRSGLRPRLELRSEYRVHRFLGRDRLMSPGAGIDYQ
jgi:hypothetical protein